MRKYYHDTDLALESASAEQVEKSGIFAEETNSSAGKLTRIRITSDEASERLRKPKGNYITLEYNGESFSFAVDILSEEIGKLFPGKKPERVLVAGLGNRQITPDSLGSLVSEYIYPTRALDLALNEKNHTSVSTVAPGVFGCTGIETSELVAAAAEITKPDLIIICDSLAARDVHRIGNTFQITDSGIEPGAGLGNRREKIDSEMFGCKVISIGVPTVVYCRTICHNVMEQLLRKNGESENEAVEAVMAGLDDEFIEELVVTPKDIDMTVRHAAKIIAGAINKACGTDTLADVFEDR